MVGEGNMVFAAGVVAGIDGAPGVLAELRGDDVERTSQLYMHAPEQPGQRAGRKLHPKHPQASEPLVRDIRAPREATAAGADRLAIPAPFA
jgi:cyclohexyl-isocyanide hydratase